MLLSVLSGLLNVAVKHHDSIRQVNQGRVVTHSSRHMFSVMVDSCLCVYDSCLEIPSFG